VKNEGTVVLGIDPGLSLTGWGVVLKNGADKISLIEYGCVKTDTSKKLVDRLKSIYLTLTEIIQKHKPELMAIEELFFMKRASSVAQVGQARGAILLSAAMENLPVFEYNPRHVKMALTGYGSADKNQIQQMVKLLLRLKEIPKPDDSADALALAICHINSVGSGQWKVDSGKKLQ
jgi:crossover junction endodeoxyribonuclease RuvC